MNNQTIKVATLSDLKVRIITATLLILVIVLFEYLSLNYFELNFLTPALTFVLVLLCGYEYLNLIEIPFSRKDNIRSYFYYSFIYCLLLLLPLILLFVFYLFNRFSAVRLDSSQSLLFICGLSCAFILLGLIAHLGNYDLNKSKQCLLDLFPGLLMIGFGGACLFKLSTLESHGYIIWLLIVTSSVDIGAYFIGKNFGRIKLSKYISPKKTVEGGLGGLLCGIFMGILSFKLVQFNALLFSILVGIAGQLFDLLKSFVKRSVGVKDSSSLLPGHGGFLDRMDSVLGGAIVVYVGIVVL